MSFKKGCYIGQETIARLKTYDGVKKKLFGVDFSAPVEAGAAVLPKGGTENAGVVTSAGTTSDGRHIALAYIKSKVRISVVSPPVARRKPAMPY